jgi:hypothetical protein
MYKKNRPGFGAALVVRSTVHVRDIASPGIGGYFLVTDKADVGDGASHVYSFQVVLANGLEKDAGRSRAGVITLTDNAGKYLDVHVQSKFGNVTHEIAPVLGGVNNAETLNVLYIRSTAKACEFWVALHPHVGPGRLDTTLTNSTFAVAGEGAGGYVNYFTLDTDGSVVQGTSPWDLD